MTIVTQRPEEILAAQADIARKFTLPALALSTYVRRFMVDAATRGGWGTARTMFYPAISDGETRITQIAADALCHIIGVEVAESVTYEITAEMAGIMQDVNTEFSSVRVDQHELPGPNGFAWFDGGWLITDRQGVEYQVRAVSWSFMRARLDPRSDPKFGNADTWPCVRLTLWIHAADDPVEAADAARDRILGSIQLIHSGVLPLGLEMDIERGSDLAEATRLLRMVHLLWMFLGMEIITTRKQRVKNHYRKRFAKSLKHGEVNVVLLRRVRHAGPEPEESERVDWSCRWVVQGHWRHLTNPKAVEGAHVHRAVAIDGVEMGDKICAVCGGELTWVRPYIKGPDGKPLKVSRTINKLAR